MYLRDLFWCLELCGFSSSEEWAVQNIFVELMIMLTVEQEPTVIWKAHSQLQ